MKLAFKKEGLKDTELVFVNGLETALKAAWDESVTGMVDQKKLDASIEAIKATIPKEGILTADQMKDFNEMIESVKQQAIKLQKLETNPRSDLHQSISAQLKAFIDANPEKWEAFKAHESMSFGVAKVPTPDKKGTEVKSNIMLNFYTKAAGTMTVGGSTGGSAFVPTIEMVPGLVDLARNQPFIEQYANTSSTSSARIVWVEKTNPQGQAAMLGEGEVKPLISFEIKTNESFAKKVADKIKVSTEMLDDIDFIAGEIENELKYQVDMKVDAQLLAGDGVGNNLKGVTEYAGGYVLTTIKTPTPNNADAIRAGAAQIKSLNFNANYAFVNTIDGANMDLTKNNQGSYIIPPFQSANGLTIKGVQVVETNNIAVGSVLIGDMTKFVVRNYQSFAIHYGWVNDDFERNLVTILGERRLHAYIAENNTGAFIYDDFDTIKAALTPAA
jgi:HK97 family phage major capsid protein